MHPVNDKIRSFEESTLFFMFYGVPQDHMQMVASEALRSLGWRYHKGDQHWYKRNNESTDSDGPEIFCFEPTTWQIVKKSNFSVQRQDFEVPAPTQPIRK